MNENDVTITPVGTARQSYDVHQGVNVFRIRTQSPRRFLVVSLRGQYVILRTNSLTTAEDRARRNPTPAVVIDRRAVDETRVPDPVRVEDLAGLNVEDMNRDHPTTFLIAPREVRESIPVGGFAKVCIGGPVADPERVWVEVDHALDPATGRYVGRLANEPGDPRHGVAFGALLSFGPEHVSDLVRDPVAEWGAR